MRDGILFFAGIKIIYLKQNFSSSPGLVQLRLQPHESVTLICTILSCSLTSRLDWLLRAEQSEYDNWKTHAQAVDDQLSKFEAAMEDVSLDSIKQAKEQIALQEVSSYNCFLKKNMSLYKVF